MSEEATPSEHLLKMFAYDKLPPQLTATGKSYHDMAQNLCQTAAEDKDRYDALRDLLKSRDGALRSLMRNLTKSNVKPLEELKSQ